MKVEANVGGRGGRETMKGVHSNFLRLLMFIDLDLSFSVQL